MTISKTTVTVVSFLFSSWFFVDSYFAHAQDFKDQKVKTQIESWSVQQTLLYIQQQQIKRDIRAEKSKGSELVDSDEVAALRQAEQVLTTRSVHLQQLQDKATLESLKSKAEVSKIDKLLEVLAQ